MRSVMRLHDRRRGGTDMENQYMTAQCRNMLVVLQTFLTACELASLEDDGALSHAEEKVLRKIRSSAGRFQADLEKIVAQDRG